MFLSPKLNPLKEKSNVISFPIRLFSQSKQYLLIYLHEFLSGKRTRQRIETKRQIQKFVHVPPMILSIILNSKTPQGTFGDRGFMKDVSIIRQAWLSDEEIAIAKHCL